MHVLLVGHVCIDLRFDRKLLGGPPMYQIPYLLANGWSVDVLTSAASNYPFYSHPNLQWFITPSVQTTTLVHYNVKQDMPGQDDRIQIVKEEAAQLALSSHLRKNYDAIIVSGIIGEVSLSILKELRLKTDHLIVDYQSLSRNIEESTKKLTFSPPILSNLRIDVVKASAAEFSKDSKLLVDLLLITDYRHVDITKAGEHTRHHFQDTNDIVVKDSTGSGDLFLAGFVTGLMFGEAINDAIERGRQVAIANLETEGIPPFDLWSKTA